MKWIKEIDRLPLNANLVHINYSTGSTDFKTTGYYEDGYWHYRNGDTLNFHPNLKWLDESPSLSSEEEAVGERIRLAVMEFDYWRSETFKQVMPNGYECKSIDESANYQRRYTRHELYNEYLKQSKK